MAAKKLPKWVPTAAEINAYTTVLWDEKYKREELRLPVEPYVPEIPQKKSPTVEIGMS